MTKLGPFAPDGLYLYREFHNLGRVVYALSGACLFALVALVASADGVPMSGWRGALSAVSLVALLPLVILGGIYRMNRISLTDDELRVGNETFRRSAFDFAFGVQPSLVLSEAEQERIEEDWPLPPNTYMRIAGGSFGRRRGTSMLVLREAETQRLVAVFTRRSGELDSVLTGWLEQVS